MILCQLDLNGDSLNGESNARGSRYCAMRACRHVRFCDSAFFRSVTGEKEKVCRHVLSRINEASITMPKMRSWRSQTLTLRSRDGDELLLFKKGEVNLLSRNPEFTSEQYAKIRGDSIICPCPYADHSLLFVQIGFLRFEGVNHVVTWDLRITDPGMARAFVVAQYIDSPVRYSEWKTTDKFDIICKVM